MKIPILICILIISFNAYSSDLVGLWIWDKNSPSQTFSITLATDRQGLMGTYCAVGMSGNRIDCSPKYAKKFPANLNGSEFKFTTNYSGQVGIAKLTMENGKIHWRIIKQPLGEHYAPNDALLSKK